MAPSHYWKCIFFVPGMRKSKLPGRNSPQPHNKHVASRTTPTPSTLSKNSILFTFNIGVRYDEKILKGKKYIQVPIEKKVDCDFHPHLLPCQFHPLRSTRPRLIVETMRILWWWLGGGGFEVIFMNLVTSKPLKEGEVRNQPLTLCGTYVMTFFIP